MPNYKNPRATEVSTLVSGIHDRQRREERGIQKIERGCQKYTYGGIVFIYNPKYKTAVTSYPVKGASFKSGTKVTTPIMLEKYNFGSVANNADQKRIHASLTKNLSLEQMRATLRSHSVLVVDMSGSMRNDDVNGARCRSDGVWMALARDYVKNQLKSGLRNTKI